MTQELTDDILSIEELVFNDHIDGLTYEELMAKHGISKRQVGNLITKAREIIFTRLMDNGRRYFAEIWARYDRIYHLAEREYNNTQNPVFLKELRACLEAQRKMMGLDAAPLSPVNSQGQAVPDKLIIIMNPSAYEAKEKLSEIVDGKAKEI